MCWRDWDSPWFFESCEYVKQRSVEPIRNLFLCNSEKNAFLLSLFYPFIAAVSKVTIFNNVLILLILRFVAWHFQCKCWNDFWSRNFCQRLKGNRKNWCVYTFHTDLSITHSDLTSRDPFLLNSQFIALTNWSVQFKRRLCQFR